MKIYFKFYKEPYFTQDKKLEIKSKINEIFKVNIKDEDLTKRPSVSINPLKDKENMESFLEYFKTIVNDLKTSLNN